MEVFWGLPWLARILLDLLVVTGAFLLGFGLSEIPKSIWRNADWTIRQKYLSHKIAKLAVKLDNAHQELSNAIVFRDDPSFKPQGERLGENDMDYDTDERSMATLGENDMDYDTDERSMATLRRHLRGAREEYYRSKRWASSSSKRGFMTILGKVAVPKPINLPSHSENASWICSAILNIHRQKVLSFIEESHKQKMRH